VTAWEFFLEWRHPFALQRPQESFRGCSRSSPGSCPLGELQSDEDIGFQRWREKMSRCCHERAASSFLQVIDCRLCLSYCSTSMAACLCVHPGTPRLTRWGVVGRRDFLRFPFFRWAPRIRGQTLGYFL
jgi:hypothetical protein